MTYSVPRRIGAPNPAWTKRPKNDPWDAVADAVLIESINLGIDVVYVPAMIPGQHDWGDILQRRLELVRAGLAKYRKEI